MSRSAKIALWTFLVGLFGAVVSWYCYIDLPTFTNGLVAWVFSWVAFFPILWMVVCTGVREGVLAARRKS